MGISRYSLEAALPSFIAEFTSLTIFASFENCVWWKGRNFLSGQFQDVFRGRLLEESRDQRFAKQSVCYHYIFLRSEITCFRYKISIKLSLFKLLDDRFIVKQMSRFEIQSFLDFAPHYFDYMTTAFQEKRPTVLAKIVGVFRIGFKNSVTTSASKMDILIMENLFYGRSISQKFDLKGSIRNRLATATGKEQEDLVLLDENLLNSKFRTYLFLKSDLIAKMIN